MKKMFTIINLVVIFFILDFTISAVYEQLVYKLDIGRYSKAVDITPPLLEKKQFLPQSHYNSITARDLFETEKKQAPVKPSPAAPVAPEPDKIQITELKLELKGTITGTGSDPFAVIRKKNEQKEMLYTVGDMVDKALIKAILREQVILVVDGREEILLMKKISAKNDAPAAAQAANPPLAPIPEGGFVEKVTLTWDDVKTLSSDVENLSKMVRIRPHFYKNQMDGFRITGIRNDSVFYTKLGLRNGDIMAGVNDKQMRSADDVINFYNEFKQLDGNVVTDVEIKRGGQPGKIRYSIE